MSQLSVAIGRSEYHSDDGGATWKCGSLIHSLPELNFTLRLTSPRSLVSPGPTRTSRNTSRNP